MCLEPPHRRAMPAEITARAAAPHISGGVCGGQTPQTHRRTDRDHLGE